MPGVSGCGFVVDSDLVSCRPNAQADLPGPLLGQHATEKLNAAPVRSSDWFGGAPDFADQAECFSNGTHFLPFLYPAT
jgi:hypothetical protein